MTQCGQRRTGIQRRATAAILALAFLCGLIVPALAQQPQAPRGAEKARDPAPGSAPAAEEAAKLRRAAEEAAKLQEAQQRAALLGRLRLQINRQPAGGDEPEALSDVFISPEREVLKPLFAAREALEQERYSDAVRALGVILELGEDYFFQPDPNAPIHRSLKSEALRIIGQMPRSGREAYELLYGARAQQMLEAAVAAADTSAIAEVSRRFFHTRAGNEATYLLGMTHLDHGQPLAAALCLTRLAESPALAQQYEPALSVLIATCLSRAGMPEKANEVLAALAKKLPGTSAKIAGRDSKLFEPSGKPSQVLTQAIAGQQRYKTPGADEWAMFRGGVARNAASVGSSPLLNARWRVPNSNDPVVEKLVQQVNDSYAARKQVALPALHPLAVGDVVLMRTTTNLLAVDFKTGKRIWEVPVEDTLEQVLTLNAKYASSRGVAQVAGGLEQRVWDDAIFGTLSSDGECVFSVEDLDMGLNWSFGMDPRLIGQRRVIQPNGRERTPVSGSPSNRLAAHDIHTGKLKWELGGPRGDGELDQADSFFLGPPLPLVGRLYVLAEARGEIRLFVLEAETGKVEWSQQLAVVDRSVSQDAHRRSAGASPSYADGVLVCPTSAGAIVAVDLTTRSLLWGYRYPRPVDRFRARQFGVFPGGFGMAVPGEAEEHWVDATVTIASGRVLVTPAESDELYCLDLLDGSVLWSKPRGDSLYLGCVQDGIVFLVGRADVRGLKLADGSPAWTSESSLLPPGNAPSGRGFFNAGRYYLPLSSAEVAAIDVASGEVVARSKSRKDTTPGNLICYQGSVISQGVTHVESFFELAELQRQVAQTLRERPGDPEALSLRGEVLLQEGKLDEAVLHLRRAYQAQTEPRTQQLLGEALLELLRSDYTSHRQSLAELEQLVDRPEQVGTLWRVVATGEQQAGNRLKAFDAYLKLTTLPQGGTGLERIDNAHSVRRDRWVQARLAELWQQASPDELQKMNAEVAARLLDAKSQPNALTPDGSLRQFVRHFGQHPSAVQAWDELASGAVVGQSPLEMELMLLRLSTSNDPAQSRSAVARLAALLKKAGHPESAAVFYRRLAGELADEVCLDGKTGRQLVAELPDDSPLRRQLAAGSGDPWPAGLVEVEDRRGQFSGNNPRSLVFDFSAGRSPFFTSTHIETDTQTQSIVARDGFNRVQWRLPQADVGQMRTFSVGANWNQARAAGHLIVISTGAQLSALDVLASPAGGSAKKLWTQDLVEVMPGMRSPGMISTAQMVRTPWGQQQVRALDANGQPIGSMGPVTASYVCFAKLRDLVAVDPLTGEELWRRHDLQPGSEIFGDEELVFVAPPDGVEATVLRAIDGQELGRRSVVPRESRMATLGRYVLSWNSAQNQTLVKLSDPWGQEELWTHECSPSARAALLGDEAVGILEPNGDTAKFVLRSLPDGRKLIESAVSLTAGLTDIHVLRSLDRYLLVANGRSTRTAQSAVQPVQAGGIQNHILVNGHIHAFDRETGRRVWTTAVENQAMALEQPSEIPVLILAAMRTQRARNPIGTTRTTNTSVCAVLCLDKRNGRRLIDQPDLGGAIQTYEVAVDLPAKTVELKTVRGAYQMTFTDKPWPSDEEAATPPASKSPEGESP